MLAPGWQPRWFVLENGVISYYDSEDDVGKGSKGSIKMSVCDIKVHPSDLTRLELIIPGEQHFYVRAVNAAERQRWLVALGSSKAGTLDAHKNSKGVETTHYCLKTKMSELRLYCDLLVQQVHTIQSQHSADADAPPKSEASLLSATCSTFIRTLEECMTLANHSLTPELRPPERVNSLFLSHSRTADCPSQPQCSQNLEGVRFRDQGPDGVQFRDQNLEGVRLRDQKLEEVRLRDQELEEVRLRDQELEGGRFRDQKLEGVRFRDQKLEGVRFRDQELEGGQFGDHRVSSLLFADDVLLLAPWNLDHHALGRFVAEFEVTGMRISTSKSKVLVLDLVLDQKKVVCPLQVGGETLVQVEEFQYLGVLFTVGGGWRRD
uniref:Sesquipedalian n=1 Tax=Salarias fasciatus TaxID=181472 RepID=A0A672HW37_SALFA